MAVGELCVCVCVQSDHPAGGWDTRGRYARDYNHDRWKRFVDTGEVGEDWADAAEVRWFRDTIRAQTAQGKRMERVRIVDQPATLGQRYLLNSAKGNIGFGEDILEATRNGSITRCGEALCVKAGADARRAGPGGEYLLLDP